MNFTKRTPDLAASAGSDEALGNCDAVSAIAVAVVVVLAAGVAAVSSPAARLVLKVLPIVNCLGSLGEEFMHLYAAAVFLVVAVLVFVLHADAVLVPRGAALRVSAASSIVSLDELLRHLDALLVPPPPLAETELVVVVLVALLAAVVPAGAGFIL